MKSWVVANQKGGVGKTTTAVTLAGLLAEEGQRVLLVDLDPHASATHYFDYEPDDLKMNLFNCFMAEVIESLMVEECILPSQLDGLDLLPSSLALATLDKNLGARQGMGLKLKTILSHVEHRYDYAIIDCPPLLGVLMINALATCQQLIIPVQTEYLAIKGLERMLKTISMVYKKSLSAPAFVVVPTMFDRRTKASVKSLRMMRNEFPNFMWRTVIPIDTQFRDASQAHQVPSQYTLDSKGVDAYRQLLRDILKDKVNPLMSAQAV